MVANKTGRHPLGQILYQFPADERAKVKEGIDAFIEMNIFVIDGRDICITNRSESLLQVINHIVGKPADEVEEMLKTSPTISSILAMINNDIRFAPPLSSVAPPQPVGKSTIGDSMASEKSPWTISGILGVALIAWGLIYTVYSILFKPH